jgi:DNA replication protein DnaD
MDNPNRYITIDNDLEVKIESLYQSETYKDVLFGYPTEHRNNRLINSILRKVHETNNPQSVYLIQPEQKLIDEDIEKYKSPLDIPKEIPNIEYHLRVASDMVTNDKNQTDSTMLIIWFQDEFAFPIDPLILEQIKTIPFRKLCFFRDDGI